MVNVCEVIKFVGKSFLNQVNVCCPLQKKFLNLKISYCKNVLQIGFKKIK